MTFTTRLEKGMHLILRNGFPIGTFTDEVYALGICKVLNTIESLHAQPASAEILEFK